MSGASPGQVNLTYTRKQADQAVEKKLRDKPSLCSLLLFLSPDFRLELLHCFALMRDADVDK